MTRMQMDNLDFVAQYGPDMVLADPANSRSIASRAGKIHDLLREIAASFRVRVRKIRSDQNLSALGQNEQIGRAVYETLESVKGHEMNLFQLEEELNTLRNDARVESVEQDSAILIERRAMFLRRIDAGMTPAILAIEAADACDQTTIFALRNAPKWFSLIDDATLVKCEELLTARMRPEVRKGIVEGEKNIDAAKRVYQALLRELRREGGFDALTVTSKTGAYPDLVVGNETVDRTTEGLPRVK